MSEQTNIVNVTDFEAKGDGASDDAPAFQRAIDHVHALHLARSRILELEQALSDLLLLPVAVQEFHYLDRGIGTKTCNAAWLRARSVLNKENGNAPD